MIEHRLHDTLTDSLAGEPPLSFDPDAVVDRAQRVQRRRRVAMASTVTVAALLIGGGAGYAVLGGDESGSQLEAAAGQDQPTTRELSEQLGDGMVEAIQRNLPDATQFDVHAAAATDRKVAGLVSFQRGEQVAAIGYLVDVEQECADVCPVTHPEYDTYRGVQAWRTDVQLTVGTASGGDFLSQALGLKFSDEHPCNCPAWTPAKLSNQERKALATDDALKLPSAEVIKAAEQQPGLRQKAKGKTGSAEPTRPLPPITQDGMGELTLGMSRDDALATGQITGDGMDSAGDCRYYPLVGDHGAVVISPSDGLMYLEVPPRGRTPEGIGAGSTAAEVEAAYPDVEVDDEERAMMMKVDEYEFTLLGDEPKVVSLSVTSPEYRDACK